MSEEYQNIEISLKKIHWNLFSAIRISLLQSDEWWVKRARPRLSNLGLALVPPQSMLQAYWTVKYVKCVWLFQSHFSLCQACKKVFSWVFYLEVYRPHWVTARPLLSPPSELYHLLLTLAQAGPGQTIGGPYKVIRHGRCQHFTTLRLRPYVSASDISHSNAF